VRRDGERVVEAWVAGSGREGAAWRVSPPDSDVAGLGGAERGAWRVSPPDSGAAWPGVAGLESAGLGGAAVPGDSGRGDSGCFAGFRRRLR
jgi:hypothetical protein